jgi:hypothetical protein
MNNETFKKFRCLIKSLTWVSLYTDSDTKNKLTHICSLSKYLLRHAAIKYKRIGKLKNDLSTQEIKSSGIMKV